MELSRGLLDEMDRVCRELGRKNATLCAGLTRRMFKLRSGWYGGHYIRDESRAYYETACPIPVISVRELCDIEILFDGISVSTNKFFHREACMPRTLASRSCTLCRLINS